MPRLTTLLALCALIAFQPSSYAAGENRKLTLEDGDRVLGRSQQPGERAAQHLSSL